MSNLPGMDYLVRVGNLWNNLLLKQSSEMQKAWSQIKGGTYKSQNAYSVWATAVEDYYGFAVDVSRGPGYIPRPAWLSAHRWRPSVRLQGCGTCSVRPGRAAALPVPIATPTS